MKTLPTPYETMDNKSRLSFVKTILPFSWRWKLPLPFVILFGLTGWPWQ